METPRSLSPPPRPLAPTVPRGVVSGDRATDQVLASLAFGEAPRVGIIGDTGTGKTEAARRLVLAYLARVPGTALVIDDKELRPRFDGQCYRDVAEMNVRRPAAEPRVIVFRGDVRAGVQVNAESVAQLAWSMQALNRPTLTVYDEIARAAKKGEWRKGVEKIPAAFGQGRAVGIASMWGTQSPQDAPREAFEQSSYLLVFRVDGMGLNLLRHRRYAADERLREVIPSLPGDELPPKDRGYFVLLRRGRPWDGFVYRYAV